MTKVIQNKVLLMELSERSYHVSLNDHQQKVIEGVNMRSCLIKISVSSVHPSAVQIWGST